MLTKYCKYNKYCKILHMSSLLKKKNDFRLGAAIRRIRRQRKLTQLQLSNSLGISTSYLNLIENNRRNVTGKILVSFAKEFNVELSELAAENNSSLLNDLMEVFSDVIFDTNYLKNHDVQDLVSSNPEVARAIIRLYDLYKTDELRDKSQEKDLSKNKTRSLPNISAETISDLLQKNSNYFPSLEDKANEILNKIKSIGSGNIFSDLKNYLSSSHKIRVATLPPEAKHSTVRFYDPIAKTLVLSDRLPQASITFLIAQQIGLISADNEINSILKDNEINDIESIKLGRAALASYLAAAILMPYESFLEQAKIAKYDIEVLEHRFQTSFEQVCHRLTTLHKPGNRGIPFHLMRVDIAGNISKRFSSSGITIPRYSGACPRLNIYSAFTTPGKVKVQISEMPDGEKYFCLARAFSKRGGSFSTPESYYSIGLGCGLSEAKDMIYSENILLDAIKNAVPVGISCRTCPRTDCSQRAFPPNDRALIFDENIRGISSYVTPI